MRGKSRSAAGFGGDGTRAAEPGEQATNAAEAGDLGVDDQWFASAWRAVGVEVQLVGFEDTAGEMFFMKW